MSDIRGSDLKAITVEFSNSAETQKAQKVFNDFQYLSGKELFPISAHVESSRQRRRSPSPYEYTRDSYSRGRSRSPLYETSKLDLEIELLKKQRMIIEEERRLLLERKKLELVKEFGPRALQGFQSSELTRGRRRDYRPREPSPVRSRPRKRPRFDRPKTPPKPKMAGQSKKLPYFRWPCKLILKDMKDIILASGVEPTKEIIILQKMIRITLRKRLAVLCEGKPIMLASELAALYREEYPVTADETFVAKQLNDLRGSHMSMGDDGEMGKDTEKDKKKKSGKKPNEELVEKKNGEEVKEGQKAIKTEGIEDSKVEQDKPEKSHEVHDVTDTTDLTETTVEIVEKKIDTIDVDAITDKDLVNISEEQLSCKDEGTLINEEVMPEKEQDIPQNDEEVPNKTEEVPDNEKKVPDEEQINSNKEENNERNIKNAEEKSMSLDDWTKLNSTEIVMDVANMDDWTGEADG